MLAGMTDPSDPTPRPAARVALVAGVAALVGGLIGAGIVGLVLGGGQRGPAATPVIQLDGASDPDVVTAVAAVALPSVVRVQVAGIGATPGGNGSGAVVSDDGHIVTNLHVVEGASRIEVTFHDGEHEEAALIGGDPDTDLAVIQVGRTDVPPLSPADIDELQVGQLAVAIGSPFGLDGTVTVGVVSALDRPIDLIRLDGSSIRLPRALQTDAEINPGNSGGPLVDSRGRMIGITSAILSGDRPASSGVGFAVPVDLVTETVEALIEEGRVVHPRLGISGRSITPLDGRDDGIVEGVLVESVADGTAADQADVRPDDVLVALDGQPLSGIDDLVDRVRAAGVGATIVLDVVRDGRTIEVLVTLQPDGP